MKISRWPLFSSTFTICRANVLAFHTIRLKSAPHFA